MFRHSRVNRLRAAGDDSASYEFADAGEYEVGDVSDVDAVEGCDAGDAAVDRQQELAPADGPEPEGRRTCGHGQDDELPSAGFQLLAEISPFYLSEREPEEEEREGCRSRVFYYLLYCFFHLFLLKIPRLRSG